MKPIKEHTAYFISVLAILLVFIALSFLTSCNFFNRRPVAVLTASPTEGSAPLKVIFNASGSADPDGQITKFELDFGDGTERLTGSGVDLAQVITHKYMAIGTFTATLTVTDNNGAKDTAAVEIIVHEPLPPPPPG